MGTRDGLCRDCQQPRPVQATYCEPCSATKKRARRVASRQKQRATPGYRAMANHRKRARHYGVEYQVFDPRDVYDRDDWMCGICHTPIDPDLRYPDLMSVSLDHILPLSRGGGHTVANTQPAHFICNSTKAAGG